jgi:foldase protein PrsA
VFAIAVAGCGSSVPGDSVADVAGNPISSQALNHWMYVAAKRQASQSPGQPVIVPGDPPNFDKCIAQARKAIPSLAKTPTKTLRADCKQLFTSLSGQIMDFLITSYWFQAEAAKQGIKVTDAEVQKAFDTAKKQNPQVLTQAGLQSFLKSTGQTLPDVLYQFRINEVIKKLMAKHPTKITPAQIQSYYNSHPTQFGTPESRNLRVVLAKNQADALAAKKALDSGQSWAEVAKKYSTDPTSKNNGGLLTGITKQQADPALAQAAFSAPLNKLLGPVKGQFGYYLFDVAKIKPGTQQSLAQATALIRQQLTTQQQQTAQTAITNQAKKDWLSQTTCRSGYAMADCKGYKAPKTATTGTSTGTSTG